MIHAVWHQLPVRFDTLELDEFVVMPTHIHGILVLQEGDSKTGNHKDRPYATRNINRRGESRIRPHPAIHTRPRGTLPDTVGRIIQAFKSIATHVYITGVKQHGWPPFGGKLWLGCLDFAFLNQPLFFYFDFLQQFTCR